jgi:serine/threonine protein kinase
MQERFNRYRPTKQITSKPSGSVYLAHPTNHASQKVILKVFKAASFSSKQDSHTFLQQAKRIRQLKHSSIVPILDFGVEQGQPYLVREYLASDSLRHRLDGLSPQGLDLQDVLKIIFQVGQALCYAHQHQILHGNLKPENIFFNSNGEVLLADFGIASGIDVTKLDDHSNRQTMSYLAPEQLAGSITEKSDQYALACLTYELITGHVPFPAQSFSPVVSLLSGNGEPTNADEKKESENKDQADIFCENKQCTDYGKVGRDNIRKFGKTRKGVQRWQCKTCRTTWSFSSMDATLHDPIPLSDLVPNLPESIEEVVLKAMAKDPSKRYADISIFLNALQITLLLPTSPFTSISPVTPLPTSIPNLVEKMPNEVPVTIHVREHWKHMQNDYYTIKALEMPDSDTYHTSKTLSTPNSDTYLPSKALSTPNSDTYLSSKALSTPNSDTYLPSKALSTPNSDTYLPSKALVETLPEGRRPQHSKPLAPTLWLAFALSGITLLLGTMILYALVPSHSPGSAKLVKSNPTIQPSVQVMNTPTVQPSVQITTIPTIQPPVPITKTSVPSPTTFSTQMAVEPSVSNNCNEPNWSKPPNNANNDYPSNEYYVVTLNGNASCYTANWVIPSGPTTAETCDFTTLFTRNTNAEVIYTFTNQNGRKRSFDTNIDSSPYWMVFQSLRNITSIELTAKDGQSPTTMSAGPFTLSNCH